MTRLGRGTRLLRRLGSDGEVLTDAETPWPSCSGWATGVTGSPASWPRETRSSSRIESWPTARPPPSRRTRPWSRRWWAERRPSGRWPCAPGRGSGAARGDGAPRGHQRRPGAGAIGNAPGPCHRRLHPDQPDPGGRVPGGRAGRHRVPGRPERRWQDHDPPHDHGLPQPRRRPDRAPWPIDRRPAHPRHLRRPDGRRERPLADTWTRPTGRAATDRVEAAYAVFPDLRRHGARGAHLSGAERKVPAIACAPVLDPRPAPPRRALRGAGPRHRPPDRAVHRRDGRPGVGRSS